MGSDELCFTRRGSVRKIFLLQLETTDCIVLPEFGSQGPVACPFPEVAPFPHTPTHPLGAETLRYGCAFWRGGPSHGLVFEDASVLYYQCVKARVCLADRRVGPESRLSVAFARTSVFYCHCATTCNFLVDRVALGPSHGLAGPQKHFTPLSPLLRIL